MQFADGMQAEWEHIVEINGDFYGSGVVRYAERWADLMEVRIGEGDNLRPVAEVAQRASHDADTEGITGFMYGAAVSILAKVWVHGEDLRRWNNLDLQIGTEGEKANEDGGVLNPALLSVQLP